MDREGMKNLISKAKGLGVEISAQLLSQFEAGSMNGGQETYFLRQLETGIEQKHPKDTSTHPSAEKVLIEKAKGLGVDVGPYSQLLKPGSVSSMVELKLKSNLKNDIAEAEREEEIMDKIKFDNLVRKAKLTGLKVSGLLAQWEQAKLTENEVAEELTTRLDKVYKAMFKQHEFVLGQRVRQLPSSRDGFFKTELPPGAKKPRSRIVLCDQCLLEVALLKDLKNTYIPIKASDFEPLSDRDTFPPFHPASVWPNILCRTCGFRVSTEKNKLLLSDGYLEITEKPVEPIEDLQTENVETSQPKS